MEKMEEEEGEGKEMNDHYDEEKGREGKKEK